MEISLRKCVNSELRLMLSSRKTPSGIGQKLAKMLLIEVKLFLVRTSCSHTMIHIWTLSLQQMPQTTAFQRLSHIAVSRRFREGYCSCFTLAHCNREELRPD